MRNFISRLKTRLLQDIIQTYNSGAKQDDMMIFIGMLIGLDFFLDNYLSRLQKVANSIQVRPIVESSSAASLYN